MFHYLISVQTGFGRDTSTTSKVGFVLSGEFADSGVRKLSDDKRKVNFLYFIIKIQNIFRPILI
jgi:hypothetical protein